MHSNTSNIGFPPLKGLTYLGDCRTIISSDSLDSLRVIHWFFLISCLVAEADISLLGLQDTWHVHLGKQKYIVDKVDQQLAALIDVVRM